MKWIKLGHVFCATGQNQWMVNGGRAPITYCLGGDIYRIFFASYDAKGRGRIFSLEINLNDIGNVTNITTTPVLDLGNVGFYDDNGIIPSDLLEVDGKLYLYTIGFSIKNKIIFDAASGLAISHDKGKSFDKLPGPVLDRGIDNPCFAASPCVIKESGIWHMWYVSCDRWEAEGSNYKHFYNIKHSQSQDGIYWEPRTTVCIDYANEYEYAISRPSVIYDKNKTYRMWYSFRAQKNVKTYRIGYAESNNGLDWIRMDDDVGIDVSNDGWDSEMICYPHVFEHKECKYMLYNGNGYGKTGFGLAILEED